MPARSSFLLTAVLVGCSGGAAVSPSSDAGAPDADVEADATSPPEAGGPDADAAPPPDTADAPDTPDATPDASAEAGDDLAGWSVRKRLRSAAGRDLVLEEQPISFTTVLYGPSRVRLLPTAQATGWTWTPPPGSYIADVCWHPSGEASVVLLNPDLSISLARLDDELAELAFSPLHDPAIATDPNVTDAGAQDLLANGFASDSARIAASGEDIVVVVDTSWNSIVAYRASYHVTWSAPQRTLLEPPANLTPFLPTGGTFDTFGAMVDWFRSPLDVDEEGNAYVVYWAGSSRFRAHDDAFHDGLAALPGDPSAPGTRDSDVTVTRMDAGGARAWSRVLGTSHEDEPYAIRARDGVVTVVGRSRRLPGFDNTAWDAFAGAVTASGDVLGSRAIPLNASSILLAVDGLPGGGFVAGGSDGWSQNPDGLSVLSYGTKLLLTFSSLSADPVRPSLTPGPRNNEIRTVLGDATRIWFGGDEDGPIMHTADGDLSQIHASGVLGDLAR
jgi:hypothetical protein